MKPLAHFLLLGGLLFGAVRVLPDPAQPREPVRIAPAELAALRAQWPDPTRFRAALEQRIREEVLLREALARGLDGSDPVVRQRLLANLRFAGYSGDDAALLREARALRMAERDLVVRRRLVQVMEQALAGGAGPTVAELASALARHRGEARISFHQVFFAEDHAAAGGALAALRGGAKVAGEPFLLGAEFKALSASQLVQRFGAAFAEAIAQAPPGVWAGPYRSTYGLHLVRVEHVPAAAAEVAALRAPLAYALQHEQRQRRVRDETARLRAAYRVELP